MNHLVIGRGEVGSALARILDAHTLDVNEPIPVGYGTIHICFPYSPMFREHVRDYQAACLNRGGLTVIHSSVPIGTSWALDAVHSPIRGVHPHLEEGIRTFTKYFGGKRAQEAAMPFLDRGIWVEWVDRSEDTEALKLWDTTAYGLMIVLQKEIRAYCDKHRLDYDLVYRAATESYNRGYDVLGMPHVQRPVMKDMPGPIGGHCVIPNAALLGGPVADFVLARNEEYR